MKNIVTKFLITCLLAISLHGFGTNEHVFKTDAGAKVLVLENGTERDDINKNFPNLGAACEICQVVHEYVILDPNTAFAVDEGKITHADLFAAPPLAMPDDILHPPTV